jgi:hypothetical protein
MSTPASAWRKGLLLQDREGFVVDDVAIGPTSPSWPVDRVRVERDIGDDAELRENADFRARTTRGARPSGLNASSAPAVLRLPSTHGEERKRRNPLR